MKSLKRLLTSRHMLSHIATAATAALLLAATPVLLLAGMMLTEHWRMGPMTCAERGSVWR